MVGESTVGQEQGEETKERRKKVGEKKSGIVGQGGPQSSEVLQHGS